jgi:hypothetical protein
MQEMSVAWQMTVDMRLGLFAVDDNAGCLVPGCWEESDCPKKINIGPHNLWTHVSIQLRFFFKILRQ